tara:strand:+ start:456 stop:629 length:174 start_codon:yes stop_codon:yes gene_type:complete
MSKGMYLYYVRHKKHGVKTLEAKNTYNACKKFASLFNLNSISGISAYTITKKETSDA